MVATYDWDLFGAKKTDLITAYIERKNEIYNPCYNQADFSCFWIFCVETVYIQLMNEMLVARRICQDKKLDGVKWDHEHRYWFQPISKFDKNKYILKLIKTKNISKSQQNQRINSIKFNYEKVLG